MFNFLMVLNCLIAISASAQTSDIVVEVKDFKESHNFVAFNPKTKVTENIQYNSTGKMIIFYAENKTYFVQITDANQSFNGSILTLKIMTKIPINNRQNKEITHFKVFTQINSKLDIFEQQTEFIGTEISTNRYEYKSANTVSDHLMKAVLTASYIAEKDSLGQRKEWMTTSKPNLNFVDPLSGVQMNSVKSHSVLTTSQAGNLASMLGLKVSSILGEFVVHHEKVHAMNRKLKACFVQSTNCDLLKQQYEQADKERDQIFLNMISLSDIQIRPMQTEREPETVVYLRPAKCPMNCEVWFNNWWHNRNLVVFGN